MTSNNPSPVQINGNHAPGLKVLIVGAGIGGLAAAIGLRRNGHQVDVYESSRFATELGAAIHLPPNANGVLKKLGVDGRKTGANGCDHISMYLSHGDLMTTSDLAVPNSMWQHEWLLGHRVRLHNALKETALSPEGQGSPVNLHLSSPVDSVDPSSATITLHDGTVVQGDVVLGADGVHSVTRKCIQDEKPFSSGKSAFRFLVPRQLILDDPQTARFQGKEGELVMIYGPDRRMVMYPTTNNTLVNFVCIHPEEESAALASGDWNNDANLEIMLDVYKDFHQDFRAALRKVDTTSLKVWKLLDMKPLDTWVNDRLALLGDAAHPFLPHQGQGGAVAIEDAAALSVVLEKGIAAAEIPERLQLYQRIRKERADTLQHYTRLAGEDFKPGHQPFDFHKFTAYNFGHDEFDNAAQKLREWKWSKSPHTYQRMPIAFGPMPGPRQSHWGKPRDGTHSTFTTASIKFKTSRTVLQTLFPPGSSSQWRFKSPGTVAYASFSQTTLDKMEWLGGRGYHHFGLYIHGVEYVPTASQDGASTTPASGTYLPILFESLTDPIISGREELGMPKLHSSIDIDRSDPTSHKITLGWQGATWAHIDLTNLTDQPQPDTTTANITGSSDPGDQGILVHRSIPSVGASHRGTAESSFVVFDPFTSSSKTSTSPRPQVNNTWKAQGASIEFTPFSAGGGQSMTGHNGTNGTEYTTKKEGGEEDRDEWGWNTFPTLWHVISRLAEIPIYEVVDAKVVEGTGVGDVSGARPV